MLPDATNIDPVAAIGKNVAHPLVSRHQAALLVNDDSVQRLGQRYCPTVRGNLTSQEFQECRLARTICAHDANAVAALDTEREILDDRPFAECLRYLFGHNDALGFHIIGRSEEHTSELQSLMRTSY